MESHLTWEKGIFKSSYELFEGGMCVGRLKPDTWSRQGNGELNGKIIKQTVFYKNLIINSGGSLPNA